MDYESPRHLDLFSGIGGFALAAEKVWPDIEHTFCEVEPFARAVLQKNWPNATIVGDIRLLKIKHRVDLLTGGFPCQPFSLAGKRRGKDDDRYLWPEMLRLVGETHPHWIVGENVAGIVSLALDQVLFDLEREGYEATVFIIPACAVNAPQRRDRVWIVAHANNARSRASNRAPKFDRASSGAEWKHAQPRARRHNCWNEAWHEVASRLCRVDDGVPPRLDRGRRLKALGNAIVPQIAEQIFAAIKAADEA